MGDGSPFPARDLAIFLAMGVIIVSLIVASIGLPLLLNGLQMPAEPSHQAEEKAARVAAAAAATAAVERLEHARAGGRPDAGVEERGGGVGGDRLCNRREVPCQ